MSDKPLKTVYFLGAGASKASDFHLPVMKEFFGKEDLSEKNFSNLREFIRKVRPYSDVETVDLEDIITYLDLSLEDLGSNWQQERTLEQKARQELYAYITKRLSPCKNYPYLSESHLKLAQTLKDSDSVLTLNYDLIMDFAIMLREKGTSLRRWDEMLVRSYGLLGDVHLASGFERPTQYHKDVGKGLYIKLHGCINWCYCPNPLCGYHQSIFPNPFSPNARMLAAPCGRCGTPLGLVIIPPTMRKSLEKFPKLGYLWNLAFRELKKADRLVFWGVSLRQSDYLLRWLIRESMMGKEKSRELIIINLELEKERLEKELGELTEPKKIRWYSDITKFFDVEL